MFRADAFFAKCSRSPHDRVVKSSEKILSWYAQGPSREASNPESTRRFSSVWRRRDFCRFLRYRRPFPNAWADSVPVSTTVTPDQVPTRPSSAKSALDRRRPRKARPSAPPPTLLLQVAISAGSNFEQAPATPQAASPPTETPTRNHFSLHISNRKCFKQPVKASAAETGFRPKRSHFRAEVDLLQPRTSISRTWATLTPHRPGAGFLNGLNRLFPAPRECGCAAARTFR